MHVDNYLVLHWHILKSDPLSIPLATGIVAFVILFAGGWAVLFYIYAVLGLVVVAFCFWTSTATATAWPTFAFLRYNIILATACMFGFFFAESDIVFLFSLWQFLSFSL